MKRSLSQKELNLAANPSLSGSSVSKSKFGSSPKIKDPSKPVSQEFELLAMTLTYTQIIVNKDGSAIQPTRHGVNRDYVRACVVTPEIAVVAVADGCSLTYWSEVAAKITVNEFVLYMQHSLERRTRNLCVDDIKQRMKMAVLATNESLLAMRHPHNHDEVINLAERGGSTTLMAAVVFPLETDNEQRISRHSQYFLIIISFSLSHIK
jgi:hypothetical protein